MAPALKRTCQVAGCNFGEDGTAYTTLEGLSTQDSVLKDLELHLDMAHPGYSNRNRTKEDSSESRPDRFPRPEITDPASDTEWSYFLSSWEAYKCATRITGQQACDQLWHCPTEGLKKKVFDSGVRPINTEEEILAGIKRLCVKAHNNMINIMAFQELHQENSETVTQFAARLNGSANICDFTVSYSCKKDVSVSEKIQTFQFIRGLLDSEIQEKILAENANKNLPK